MEESDSMGKKAWSSTGVGSLPPFSFSMQERKRILSKIDRKTVSDPDRFIRELEEKVRIFRFDKSLSEESRPKAVRDNLDRALNTAKKLWERVNELDGNSRQLLAEDGSISDLHASITTAIVRLSKARQLANQYPGKASGRLPEPRRKWLVIDVAEVFENHTGIETMKVPTGEFLSVLEVVYQAATGTQGAGLGRIATAALEKRPQMKVKHPNGMVEYRSDKPE